MPCLPTGVPLAFCGNRFRRQEQSACRIGAAGNRAGVVPVPEQCPEWFIPSLSGGWGSKTRNKKRAEMPVFLNNPDMLKSRFRLPGYWKKTYLSEEAAPGLSLKIINSVKTTVRPVESGEIIMTTFRPG